MGWGSKNLSLLISINISVFFEWSLAVSGAMSPPLGREECVGGAVP